MANHNDASPCLTEMAPNENGQGEKQFKGIVLTMFKGLREDMMIPQENKNKELNKMITPRLN